MKNIFLFWGKAERDGSNSHPAVCHMLEVGIVARELLSTLPLRLKERLLLPFGEPGENGLALAAALHDIGKISPGFQMKREDLCEPLSKAGFQFQRFADTKHGKIAADCLPGLLENELNCPEDVASVITHILAAHHGSFVGLDPVHGGGQEWDAARHAITRFLAEIFQVASLSTVLLPSTVDSLLLAGLLTLADWLGSSEKHFPFVGDAPIDIPSFLEDRTKIARALIRELHFDSFVEAEKTFTDLFPKFSPNPCQKAVLKVATQLSHPMLIVVESPMGTGKTEAAQASYSQIAASNNLRGLFYGLPTQATGNAMLSRMKGFLEKLGHTGLAELHLLHANADLNANYDALKLANIGDMADQREKSVVASSWFTGRKRGVLAGYGTGTIDQALMAILKIRHFFLRLFGLAGKMLILDEVHAYDAYMTEEISRLIGWLSQLDSSVILLSATLPQSRREKLIEAFAPGTIISPSLEYPCVLGVDLTGKVRCEPISDLPKSTIQFVPEVCDQNEKAVTIARIFKEKLAEGGCAACILNTVAEAQRVYEEVKTAIPDGEVTLFHSRFTLNRRLEIEAQILGRYGKNKPRPHKGIVVATQVIEQSLDLDFDFMISDLAPIDLLLQRAGRLHRHLKERPTQDRPLLLRNAELIVLLPDVLKGKSDFGGSQYVYFPDILMRTAVLFANHENFHSIHVHIPKDLGPLIEAVYSGDDPLVEGELANRFNAWVEKRVGSELANRYSALEATLAEVRSINDDPDYYLATLANDEDEDRMISSRLGRPNVALIILKEGAPLEVRSKEDVRLLYGNCLSTDNIQLVTHFQKQEAPSEWKDAALLRHCQPLMASNKTLGIGDRSVYYDNEFGLCIRRKQQEVV